MSNTFVIIVFVLAMVYLLVTILAFKMNAVFSLLTTALILGIAMQLDPVTLVSTVTSGFGNTMASMGLVIGLGALLGSLLGETGATEALANGILKICGEKRASLGMNIIGYIVSIPVYMGAAYIILDPINHSLARKTKKNIIVYSTALAMGLLVTHCLVIPTPGPLAVASSLGVNVGWFIFYSILVAIPASLIGGWLWGEFLGKKYPYEESDENPAVKDVNLDDGKPHPSAGMAAFLIFLPIVIIIFGVLCTTLAAEESTWYVIGTVLTSNTGFISLLISVAVAMVLLRPYLKAAKKSYGSLIVSTFNENGNMLFVLGAGGALGGVITAAGIGNVLVEVLSTANINMLLLGFLLCMLLRAAVGSAAVALITTANILGPVASGMGVDLILLGLALCAGAIGLSLPTDGGFWIPKQLDNLDMKACLLEFTVGGTICAVVAFAFILLLSVFSGVLPGLG